MFSSIVLYDEKKHEDGSVFLMLPFKINEKQFVLKKVSPTELPVTNLTIETKSGEKSVELKPGTYLTYLSNKEQSPIIELKLISSDDNKAGPGFVKIAQEVNPGVLGAKQYLAYKTLLSHTKLMEAGSRWLKDMIIDCSDTEGKWRQAKILEAKETHVFVTYLNWEKKWDEWIPKSSTRLASRGTHVTGYTGHKYETPKLVYEIEESKSQLETVMVFLQKIQKLIGTESQKALVLMHANQNESMEKIREICSKFQLQTILGKEDQLVLFSGENFLLMQKIMNGRAKSAEMYQLCQRFLQLNLEIIRYAVKFDTELSAEILQLWSMIFYADPLLKRYYESSSQVGTLSSFYSFLPFSGGTPSQTTSVTETSVISPTTSQTHENYTTDHKETYGSKGTFLHLKENIEFYGQNQGFDALLDRFQHSDSFYKDNLTSIRVTIQIFASIVPFLKPDFVKDFLGKCKPWNTILLRISKLTEDEIKTIDKVAMSVITDMRTLLQQTDPSSISEFEERLRLSLAHRLIQSHVLARKLEGCAALERVVHNLKNQIPFVKRWLTDNQIVVSLLGGSDVHEQVIMKSIPVLKFLATEDHLDETMMSFLWNLTINKPSSMVKVAYRMWLEIQPALTLPSLTIFFQKLVMNRFLNGSTYKATELDLTFLHDFTKGACDLKCPDVSVTLRVLWFVCIDTEAIWPKNEVLEFPKPILLMAYNKFDKLIVLPSIGIDVLQSLATSTYNLLEKHSSDVGGASALALLQRVILAVTGGAEERIKKMVSELVHNFSLVDVVISDIAYFTRHRFNDARDNYVLNNRLEFLRFVQKCEDVLVPKTIESIFQSLQSNVEDHCRFIKWVSLVMIASANSTKLFMEFFKDRILPWFTVQGNEALWASFRHVFCVVNLRTEALYLSFPNPVLCKPEFLVGFTKIIDLIQSSEHAPLCEKMAEFASSLFLRLDYQIDALKKDKLMVSFSSGLVDRMKEEKDPQKLCNLFVALKVYLKQVKQAQFIRSPFLSIGATVMVEPNRFGTIGSVNPDGTYGIVLQTGEQLPGVQEDKLKQLSGTFVLQDPKINQQLKEKILELNSSLMFDVLEKVSSSHLKESTEVMQSLPPHPELFQLIKSLSVADWSKMLPVNSPFILMRTLSSISLLLSEINWVSQFIKTNAFPILEQLVLQIDLSKKIHDYVSVLLTVIKGCYQTKECSMSEHILIKLFLMWSAISDVQFVSKDSNPNELFENVKSLYDLIPSILQLTNMSSLFQTKYKPQWCNILSSKNNGFLQVYHWCQHDVNFCRFFVLLMTEMMDKVNVYPHFPKMSYRWCVLLAKLVEIDRKDGKDGKEGKEFQETSLVSKQETLSAKVLECLMVTKAESGFKPLGLLILCQKLFFTDEIKSKLASFLLSSLFTLDYFTSPKTRTAAYQLLLTLSKETVMVTPILKHAFHLLSPENTHKDTYDFEPKTTSKRSVNHQTVGLQNLGSTCYINCNLQQLFHLERLREDILRIEIEAKGKEELISDPLYQLQHLFSTMELTTQSSVCASNLIATMRDGEGQKINVKVQDDALAFYQRLIDKLESHLRGTLYGHVMDRVLGWSSMTQKIGLGACKHVTQREQPQNGGLEIIVKDKRSLDEGLKNYVSGDQVTVHCVECNAKVECTKRDCFGKLAETMVFSLKRFDIDQTGTLQKLNSRFEFPMKLNLQPFCAKSMALPETHVSKDGKEGKEEKEGKEGKEMFLKSKEAKELKQATNPYEYELVGVVIHMGSLHGGHYYSLVRSQNKWFKFNDSIVTPFDESRIPDEAFGSSSTSQNAFMLYYSSKASLEMASFSPSLSKEPKLNPALKQQIQLQNETVWRDRCVYDVEYFDFLYQCVLNGMKSVQPTKTLAGLVAIHFSCSTLSRSKLKNTGNQIAKWFDLLGVTLPYQTTLCEWLLHYCFEEPENWFSDLMFRCGSKEMATRFAELLCLCLDRCQGSKDRHTRAISSSSVISPTCAPFYTVITHLAVDAKCVSTFFEVNTCFKAIVHLDTFAPEQEHILKFICQCLMVSDLGVGLEGAPQVPKRLLETLFQSTNGNSFLTKLMDKSATNEFLKQAVLFFLKKAPLLGSVLIETLCYAVKHNPVDKMTSPFISLMPLIHHLTPEQMVTLVIDLDAGTQYNLKYGKSGQICMEYLLQFCEKSKEFQLQLSLRKDLIQSILAKLSNPASSASSSSFASWNSLPSFGSRFGLSDTGSAGTAASQEAVDIRTFSSSAFHRPPSTYQPDWFDVQGAYSPSRSSFANKMQKRLDPRDNNPWDEDNTPNADSHYPPKVFSLPPSISASSSSKTEMIVAPQSVPTIDDPNLNYGRSTNEKKACYEKIVMGTSLYKLD